MYFCRLIYDKEKTYPVLYLLHGYYDDENSLAYDNFINDLEEDVMPLVEKTFSISKGTENTAIAGFSVGGREALYIGV